MRLNLEECCVRVTSDEEKNKYGNWVVYIHCGAPLSKTIEEFEHGCDMVYQFSCYSREDAENWALRKFIVDRFKG